jgi:hypothetical protein
MPKKIVNNEMVLQKLEFMHNSPVASGYADEPIRWRYSSARNYAGFRGLGLREAGNRLVAVPSLEERLSFLPPFSG